MLSKRKVEAKSFEKQSAKGSLVETLLKKLIERDYRVISYDYDTVEGKKAQHKGQDFVVDVNSVLQTCEIKYNSYAAKSNCFFIEDALNHKQGWCYTCTSEFIFLVIGDTGRVVVTSPQMIQKDLQEWKESYKTKRCASHNGYWSEGVIVPLEAIKGWRFSMYDQINIMDYLLNTDPDYDFQDCPEDLTNIMSKIDEFIL